MKNLLIARRSLRLLGCLAFAAAAFIAPRGMAAQEQKSNAKAAVTPIEKAQTENSAQESQQGAASPKGNADDGKKIYMSDGCFECHGTVGQGSTSTGGVRIGPPSISFDAMVQYLHHPSGQMPPYTSKVISDQELADIYAYLKSQPHPPAAKDIPLLTE